MRQRVCLFVTAHTHNQRQQMHTHAHTCVCPLFRIEPQVNGEGGRGRGEGKTWQGKAAVLRAAVFICASNLRIIAALITFTPLYDKRKKKKKNNNNNNGQIEMLHSGHNCKLPKALNECKTTNSFWSSGSLKTFG